MMGRFNLEKETVAIIFFVLAASLIIGIYTGKKITPQTDPQISEQQQVREYLENNRLTPAEEVVRTQELLEFQRQYSAPTQTPTPVPADQLNISDFFGS